MENGTNESTGTEGGQGSSDVLLAFDILLISMGSAIFVLSVPTIIALCTVRAVAKVLRIFLANLLVSGLLTNTLGILSLLIALVIEFSGAPPPPPLLCRFILWLFNIASLTRSFSVVGYSIMVLIVVQYGKNMRLLYIILSLCFVWGLSLLLSIQYQVPQVYAVGFVAGAVCLPVQDDTIFLEARLFFTTLHLIITTLVPLVVCIAVPLIVLWYIRKHAVTGSRDYGKAAAKLALFLVTGSIINSISIIVSSIVVYFSVRVDEIIYFVYITGVISLYPTPILIIIFLKPVRDKMKTFVKCKCIPAFPSVPKTAAMNQHQLQEQVFDSLIIQQYN